MKIKQLLLLTISSLFTLLYSYSQSPKAFKYQAVVRNSDNSILQNQSVGIRISLLQSSSTGTIVYQETNESSTNNLGVLNLEIGRGTRILGSFDSIDWSTGSYYLRMEIDPAGGTNYQLSGIGELLSVPYALFAETGNRGIQGIPGQDGIQGPKGDKGDKGDAGNSSWKDSLGIMSTNEKVGIGVSVTSNMLSVKDNGSVPADSALFEVKDKFGRPVFAVYEGGVMVYVNPGNKGARSGFAVGGRTQAKASPQNYFVVNTDSVRIYIDSTSNSKGARGGFAVGGRSQAKGLTQDYFAISGKKNADTINPSKPAILWYPNKEAFLTGRVLVESSDSIGTNSMATGFESKSIGNYSQAFGYQSIARGNYSTAIGFKSIAGKDNSFAFGQNAQARNIESYALGRGAIASGYRSFAFGSAGIDTAGNATGITYSPGDYSFALGQGSQSWGAGSFALGVADTSVGDYSTAIGYLSSARNWGSCAIGFAAIASGKYSTSLGMNSVASSYNSIALGYACQSTASGASAIGYMVSAGGVYATAMGKSTRASGSVSTAMGFYSIASGVGSTAIGYQDTASAYYSTAIGYQNAATKEGAISIGYQSRALGLYSTAMGHLTLANGSSSTSMGYLTKAWGYYSTAMGNTTQTYNDNALSTGFNTMASGAQSVATGNATTASGDNAVTMGANTTASGNRSIAAGNSTTASGTNTFTMGNTVTAASAYENVFGAFNTTYTPTSTTTWSTGDRLFVIANGTSTSARNNAVTVLKNGNVAIGNIAPTHLIHLSGGAYSDGATWTNASDRNLKENFEALNNEDILSLIEKLPIMKWNYKSESKDIKHIGPVAQDFYELFGLGGDDKSISSIDPSGVALVAIKELYNQNHEMKCQIETLNNALKSQQLQIEELKKLLAK